jgi:hypothetical protein
MKNVIQMAGAPVVKTEAVVDAGRVRIGGGMRLPPVKTPAEVADSGKVRIGGGMRLPPRQG